MTDISHPAPDFSPQEAEVLAQLHFGVTATASPLDSERDRNFRLKTGNGSTDWILKIVNASEPRVESEFQTALLQHLAKADPLLPYRA